MQPLDFLVILYITLTSLIITQSKSVSNPKRIPYLLVNALMALLLMAPLFGTISGYKLNLFFNWLPLLCLPILHQETELLTSAFRMVSFDEAFIRFEHRYFPWIMRFHKENRVKHPFISEYLHLCYLSFYLIIFGIPLFFYLQHNLPQFYASTFAILWLFFSCFLTHSVIPVHGPRNIFEKIKDKRSQGYFFRIVHKVLAEGSTAGTAFPSGHTGLGILTLLISWHFNRPLFYFTLPIIIGLVISTVYGRFHYLTDVIFGTIYALIAFCVMQYVYA